MSHRFFRLFQMARSRSFVDRFRSNFQGLLTGVSPTCQPSLVAQLAFLRVVRAKMSKKTLFGKFKFRANFQQLSPNIHGGG